MSMIQPGTPDWYSPQVPLPAPLVNVKNVPITFVKTYGPFFVAGYRSLGFRSFVNVGTSYPTVGVGFYADAACTVGVGSQSLQSMPNGYAAAAVPVTGAWCKLTVSSDNPFAGQTFDLLAVPFVNEVRNEEWIRNLSYTTGVAVNIAAGGNIIREISPVTFGRYLLQVYAIVKNWQMGIYQLTPSGTTNQLIGSLSGDGVKYTDRDWFVNPGTGCALQLVNQDAAAQPFWYSVIPLGD